MNREAIVKLTSNINKNSCPKNINFHCHTKFSDGSLEPYELLEQAYKNNLKFLSITDHHTIKAHEYIKKNKCWHAKVKVSDTNGMNAILENKECENGLFYGGWWEINMLPNTQEE